MIAMNGRRVGNGREATTREGEERRRRRRRERMSEVGWYITSKLVQLEDDQIASREINRSLFP